MKSVAEQFAGMTVAECDTELDRMEANYKQRMKTLRAFVRAKAVEEKGGDTNDDAPAG